MVKVYVCGWCPKGYPLRMLASKIDRIEVKGCMLGYCSIRLIGMNEFCYEVEASVALYTLHRTRRQYYMQRLQDEMECVFSRLPGCLPSDIAQRM